MEHWKKNLWILMGCAVLNASSFTMAIPFLPLFLYDLGVDEQNTKLWAGAVFSSAFILSAIMQPVWGALADKYGKKKMVVRAGVCLVIVYGLMAVVRNPWELLFVRMLHGFVGGFVPASMAIVASSSPEKRMGTNLGMMQSALAGGMIMGPLMGGLLAELLGIRLSFVAASVLVLIATLAVLMGVKDATSKKDNAKIHIREDIRMVLKNPMILKMLILLFTFQLAFNLIQPLLSLHIVDLYGKLEGAVLISGIVIALMGVATVVSAPRWGKAGQSRGYMRILILCLIVSGTLNMVQYFSGNIWQFGTIHFIFGLFFAGVVPSIHTIIIQHSDTNGRGKSFGISASATSLGAMTGSLLGGLFGLWLGIPAVFMMTGILLTASGVVVWFDSKARGNL